jgi:hypothetical protein
MKNLVLSSILLLFTCLSLHGQDVVILKEKEPFPFAEGAGLNLFTYQAVKAKLVAAEAMKVAADSAVKSLQLSVDALKVALEDKQNLIDHDSQEYQRLYGDYTLAVRTLQNENRRIEQADYLINAVRSLLPKRVQKRADTSEKVTFALEEYTSKIRKRPLRWCIAGLAIGLVSGVSLTI